MPRPARSGCGHGNNPVQVLESRDPHGHRARLADTAIAAPLIPVVNNIDVAVQTEPAAIRDALYRQAFGAVRWVETIHAMRARGVTHVIECGPGKVLAGMVKRIDAEAVPGAVFDPASLADVRGMLA